MAVSSIFNSTPVKLLISVGGIYTSYIYFGLIMERLFAHDYSGLNRPKGTFERFNFGFATSLFQNLFSFLIAAFVNRSYYKRSKSVMDLKSELIIGVCSFGSVFMASQALAFVSFPVQAIMKSSKIISILIVSLFVGAKGHHTLSQYFCGAVITAGIIIFNLMEGSGKKKDSETSLIGIAIIMVSLFCDGFLGVTQSDVKNKFKPNQWDQMESLNKWSGLICLVVSLVTFQMNGFINFIIQYPAVIPDLVLLALLGTFGQIFIFFTIANFSPLLLSIVTTTRKFFTVLASIFIFGHDLNTYQWLAVGLVFLGVFAEMASGMKSKKAEGGKTTAGKGIERKYTPTPAVKQTPATKKAH